MNDNKREPDWAERAIGAISMGVAAGLLFLLAPGIIVNWSFNRFEGNPEGLLVASLKDGVTWLFSFVFWTGIATLIFMLYRRHAKGHPAAVEDNTGAMNDETNGYGEWDQPPPATDGENVYTEASPPPADDGFESLCTDAACAEVLGLSGVITMDDIRSAYRQKIASYHPDKVAHLGPKLRDMAELESKRLNMAYQYFEERYHQDA